jgi:hypothetical protein
MSNSSSQPQTPSPKRTRRRPKPFFLVCLAFLLGLVLASVTVLTLRGGDAPSTQRPGAVTTDAYGGRAPCPDHHARPERPHHHAPGRAVGALADGRAALL